MELSVELSSDSLHENAPPQWLTENYLVEFLKLNFPNFKKLLNFSVKRATKAGENYASHLYRIGMQMIFDNDAKTKTISIILKTVPSEESEDLSFFLDVFSKEILMYSKIIPEFEKIYKANGKSIKIGPKYFKLPENMQLAIQPLILEDLCLKGYALQNRFIGLNMDYTKRAIKALAEFHAVSVSRIEQFGPYDEIFDKHITTEDSRTMYESIKIDYYMEFIQQYEGHQEYIEKIPNLLDNYLDLSIACFTADPKEFNVLNHGDFWLNNILFQCKKENELTDCQFIDFQLCKYGTPCIDLYMFLLSAPELDIKLQHFDYFIKCYHEHLAENLQLLKYQGKIPSLKELHRSLLKYSYIAFGTIFNCISISLLEPRDGNTNLDYLYDSSSPEAKQYQKDLFLNKQFKQHAERILLWCANRGLLD